MLAEAILPILRVRAMDRFIANENIQRYNRLLAEATDEKRRAYLRSLINEEQRKLAPVASQGVSA